MRQKFSFFTEGLGPLIARLAISLIFILAGLGFLLDFQGAVDALTQAGLPGEPALLIIGLLILLGCGFSIALGIFTRTGSLLILLFFGPLIVFLHRFWNLEGADRAFQFSLFLKNLAIGGGLLLLICYGPGKWSLEYFLSHRSHVEK